MAENLESVIALGNEGNRTSEQNDDVSLNAVTRVPYCLKVTYLYN